MSIRDWPGKLNEVTKSRRRMARAATIALAVTASCSGLVWTAVSLTGRGTDAKSPAAAPCSYTPTGGKRSVGIPAFDAKTAARPYQAKLATNMGTVTLEALTENAPCATNSFSFLARKGYFDDSKCHRVTTRGIFVLECGDPAGEGKADPGYFFRDENLDGAKYSAGTVAMSKAVPGRNGSQFFITYADPEYHMQPGWTPFARVVDGLDVLKKIAENGTLDGSTDGRPKEAVIIKSVRVR
ncbi:peptidylprolyl isomerase [Streptomyces sp. NPDC060064]|uniref:peptidylprolyl isomerase n=1 Tax=Streptomyces sp. NPDC060064 TaxID=3347049 RepID=UPI00369944C3